MNKEGWCGQITEAFGFGFNSEDECFEKRNDLISLEIYQDQCGFCVEDRLKEGNG